MESGEKKILLNDNFQIVDENKINNLKINAKIYGFQTISYMLNLHYNEPCDETYINKIELDLPIFLNFSDNTEKIEIIDLCDHTTKSCFNSLEFWDKSSKQNIHKIIINIINNLYNDYGIFYKPFNLIRQFQIMDNTFDYNTEYFSKHLKFIGGSNISYALLNYFDCGKVYLRTVYDEFKKFDYIQKTVEELNETDFSDEDIVIYTVSSCLNHGYNEEAYEKDVNNLNKVVQLCKYKNIKFVYFSSIALFEPSINIGLYNKFDLDNWYAKSKFQCEQIILENILNINTYIIRPPTIQFYHCLRQNDNALIILSYSQNDINTKNSLKSLKNNYTYPIQIDKICYLVDSIIRDYNKETFYNIQGNNKWTYDEIINGKIWNLNREVIYGDENKVVTKYYSSNFMTKIKQKNICIIIAGGKGERFGLINDLPKQFVEIGSRKLIEITYNNCYRHFDETYVVINELYKNVELNIPKENIYYVESDSRVDTIDNFLKIKQFNLNDKICIKDANCPLLNVKLLLECLSQKQSCVGVYNMCSSQYLMMNNVLLDRNKCFENEINVYNYDDILDFLQNDKKNEYQSEFEYLLKSNKLIFKETHTRTIKITYPEDLEFIKCLSNL